MDWILLGVLCLVGYLLGKWQNSSRDSGVLDPPSRMIGSTIIGPAVVLNDSGEAVSDFWDGVLNARSLSAENQRLREQNLILKQYADDVSVLAAQYDQLRKLTQLPRYAERWRIPADAIGYFPHEDRMTLSAGTNKGVIKGLPVMSAEGLLGVVQTVDAKTCQILLISSHQLQVGAMAMRNPPQVGILRGEAADRLVLGYLDTQSPIEVGDRVETSGFGPLIPRGIPIGKIVQVETNPDYGARQARVLPFVRIGNVHEVFILR